MSNDAANVTPIRVEAAPLRPIPLLDGAGYREIFRWALDELRATTPDLAVLLGCSLGLAAALVAGQIQPPTGPIVFRLCARLRISPVEFYAVGGLYTRADIAAAARIEVER